MKDDEIMRLTRELSEIRTKWEEEIRRLKAQWDLERQRYESSLKDANNRIQILVRVLI